MVLPVAAWLGCAPPPPPPAPSPVPEPDAPVPAAPAPRAVPSEGTVEAGTAGALWYRVTGTGSDTVVVPLGAYTLEALAPLAASHTLVFYDPRGRGRSSPLTDTTLATFREEVRDLEAVRAHLGVSRMAVVAYGYFAAVAVTYAADYPERVTRLVLVSPIEPTDSLERAYDPPERLARLDTAAARLLVRQRAAGRDTTDPAGYCRAFWQVNAPIFVGDTTRAPRIHPSWCDLPNESPAMLAPHLARVLASLGTEREMAPTAARVLAPVLVVHGSRDLVTNPDGARAWGRLLPRARVWPVTGAGHLVFMEDPDRVARAIDRFLRGEWPDGSAGGAPRR
jgi:proline iminopeptidase